MNISIVLGHPYPMSFNHAIAETALDELRSCGHSVRYHDLYREQFDPVLPAEELASETPVDPLLIKHCTEIAEADGIVVVHPNWWGQPPAILKGWVDRVLHHGLAYRFSDDDQGGGVPMGLLRIQKAIVFNTSNTGNKREAEIFGDPLERLWKDCIFGFCGVKDVHRTNYSIVCDSTMEQRGGWLEDVRTTVRSTFPG